MEVRFIKEAGTLQPFDSETEEWLHAKAPGQYFTAEMRTPRNYDFHKKFFALLNFAYEYWEPEPMITRHGVAERCRQQFREDLTILCGYYTVTRRLDGTERIRAKSISFANMSEDEFSVLYDRMVSKIIQTILVGWTAEEVYENVGNFL